ncbi:MAG: histidine kinase [Bacteroidales bacterium]|nr:histidine kinase [Bacteroidales bacterium]
MYRLLINQKLFFRILRHIILFLAMVLLFSWVTYFRSEEDAGFLRGFFMVFINALFFFGYAYLTVYLLIPHFLVKKKVLIFILLFILTGIGLSLLKFVFSDVIFYQAIAPENILSGNPVSLSRLLINTKDMTFIVAIFAIAKYARDHYILESNISELEQKGLEAEIKLLEHHMDPHVIFNNFNSLYSISIYRPEYLKSTVKKLKSVLHYLFNESKNENVLLAKEIEMIENYIGLEKLRYGERLDITFRTEGNPQGLKIAPLILYSFVENCFVHGAGEDPRKSWINIELSVKESKLRFFAANSVLEHLCEEKVTGKKSTNENSMRRLELQYPNSHRLTIREKRNEHVVELNMSL